MILYGPSKKESTITTTPQLQSSTIFGVSFFMFIMISTTSSRQFLEKTEKTRYYVTTLSINLVHAFLLPFLADS
jgi:hypothetical protein